MVPLSCCYNYVTVRHIGMQIFNFLVWSVIIACHSVLSSHISKTHLPIHLMYVNSNLIDARKTSQGKWEPPLSGGWKLNFPRKALRFIKRSSLSFFFFFFYQGFLSRTLTTHRTAGEGRGPFLFHSTISTRSRTSLYRDMHLPNVVQSK